MISVLCPSRGRAKLLAESIKSLGTGDFEVLVRLDEDDPGLTHYNLLYDKAKFIVGERVGYKNFHVMLNELAAHSKGEWIMIWNDDAVMFTPNWAEIIQRQSSRKPAVLNFYDPDDSVNNLFPVISRAMYTTMGHISCSTHCDSWVQDIANELGIHVPVYGIQAAHLRGQMWDKTWEESQGAYAETSPLHYSEPMQKLMQADIKKLRRKI